MLKYFQENELCETKHQCNQVLYYSEYLLFKGSTLVMWFITKILLHHLRCSTVNWAVLVLYCYGKVT